MARGVSKAGAATTGKDAQSSREPATPMRGAAKPKTPKVPVASRRSKGQPEMLTAAIASLYETATQILADRLQPTIDQIKALAHAVIGQEEKKARKAQAKAAESRKTKTPKATKAASISAKPKKKKK